MRPVCTRHRSTARCRATATMAFLRCLAGGAGAFARTSAVFSPADIEAEPTMRQAHSTSAARNAVAVFVTLPGTRLVPLLCSPGHRPVTNYGRRFLKRSHEQISRVITTVLVCPRLPEHRWSGRFHSALRALICCSRSTRPAGELPDEDRSRLEAICLSATRSDSSTSGRRRQPD